MNPRSFPKIIFALALAIALLFPVPRAAAQAISGDLLGTVLDATGASIPNVTVTATNVGTNIGASATSNANGEYRFTNLPAGTYTVTAKANGFTSATLKNVSINLNQTATANLTLQVGAVSSTVEVVEAAAAIDTTTAQVQNTFTTKQSEDLPTAGVGSGVLNFSLLGSGVASSGGVGIGTGPSVGGQRPRNNNFTIEGVDNNSKSVTGPQTVIPNDAVQEFTLLQNQFSAEYGHSSGGQFNTIVKSGTNLFHGELYEYARNRNLDALDQSFANQGLTSVPRFDENRLGGNFGGPIIKNKWFFFSDFEYNPLGQASVSGGVAYAPTAAGYSMLSGIPGINQTNLGVLEKYASAPSVASGSEVPSITVGGVSIPVGAVNTVGPNFTNSYFGVLSSDYNISDTDQLRGRFVYNRSTGINTGAQLPEFYTSVPTTNYLATLAEYHTFSPSVTNELRLGYNRQNQDFPVGNQSFPGLDQFPNLQFNDLALQVGPNPSFPQFNVNNLYQGVDNVTWTKGAHTFKFGTELRKYIAPSSFTQRSRGDYEYNNLETYLFDQTPDYLAQRGIGNSTYYGDQIATYSYVQDEWRWRPNLTITLGLRYERTTVPYSERLQAENAISSVPGLINFSAPKVDNNGWAPRVGVAYSPGKSGNTSIRAGFGMAYDVLFDNIGITTLPPQFSSTVDVTNNPTPAGGFLSTGGISPNLPGGTLTQAQARAFTSAYIPNQVLPYTINYNLEVDHVFAKNYTLQVRYLGTKGVHLPTQIQIDKGSLVSPTNNIPTFFTAPSAATLASLPLTLGQISSQSAFLPAYANAGFQSPITAYTPQGYSDYNGLALQLNRRFSNGLQYVLAYTWSHAIDNSTAEFNTTSLTPRRPQDFFDLTADKASSALDRRHRVTLQLIYDVPYFKNSSNWFMKNLVGNWEVAPIYTFESPEYYTVQSGLDSNLNGDTAGDRTVINANGAANTGTSVYGLTAAGSVVPLGTCSTGTEAQCGIVAYVANNPNARYVVAGYGALANGGRNTQPTRPINNVDMSLIKRFSFRERYGLQLQAQAFNLFNHPQFIPGSINDVGTVTSAGLTPFVSPQYNTFNNPEAFFASNARVLQVVAKFTF
jgi:hypothetical protein